MGENRYPDLFDDDELPFEYDGSYDCDDGIPATAGGLAERDERDEEETDACWICLNDGSVCPACWGRGDEDYEEPPF